MSTQTDLSKAIQFVSEHGTILEQARLLWMLMDVKPSTEAYQKLISTQNPDGGFPNRPRGESPSSLDSTLTALWQFDELGLFNLPSAQHAVEFVLAMQHPDGGWDENPGLPEHDLPPWIQPGEVGTRVYLSSYALFWLAVAGQRGTPPFERGLVYLAANQDPQGAIPGYLHSSWLTASDYLFAGDGYLDDAEQVLVYLARKPWPEWDDSQIAWALDCLTRAGLAKDHAFIQSALPELVRRQAEDGSWASEDGPAFAASATVGAIKVLRAHGLVSEIE